MDDTSRPDEWDCRPEGSSGDWIWERLAAFPEIRELALQIYSREEVEAFMTTRRPGFEWRSALELMESGQADRVFAALSADHERFPY
jgi:hypothetical protein